MTGWQVITHVGNHRVLAVDVVHHCDEDRSGALIWDSEKQGDVCETCDTSIPDEIVEEYFQKVAKIGEYVE